MPAPIDTFASGLHRNEFIGMTIKPSGDPVRSSTFHKGKSRDPWRSDKYTEIRLSLPNHERRLLFPRLPFPIIAQMGTIGVMLLVGKLSCSVKEGDFHTAHCVGLMTDGFRCDVRVKSGRLLIK